MVYAKINKLEEYGFRVLFAGLQRDDSTTPHVVMQFPSIEVIKAFGRDEELTEQRK